MKPKRKETAGTHSPKWEDNIKIGLEEKGY
jgi:hypothetical protein